MPAVILTLLPLMIVVRIAQAPLGTGPALVVGWVVFLALLFPVNHLLMRRGRPEVGSEEESNDADVVVAPRGSTTAVS